MQFPTLSRGSQSHTDSETSTKGFGLVDNRWDGGPDEANAGGRPQATGEVLAGANHSKHLSTRVKKSNLLLLIVYL